MTAGWASPLNPATGCPDPGLAEIPRYPGEPAGPALVPDTDFELGSSSSGGAQPLVNNQSPEGNPVCPLLVIGYWPCLL